MAEPEAEPPTALLQLRTTIVDAGQAFVTNRETKQVAPATLRKYVTFIKQLRAFADTRGYLLIQSGRKWKRDRLKALWQRQLAAADAHLP